jgi:hypothetical protein
MTRRSPEEIEDTEHDAALALLLSPAADRFARALDMHEWMIVSQSEYPARTMVHRRARAMACGGLRPLCA